ncbi:MAG: M1 family metallopeptidase [Flavisolibacter sp.]
MGISFLATTQPLNHKTIFTRQDTLRGSNTSGRSWWDVLHYDIVIKPDFTSKTIVGKTTIRYKVVAEKHSDYMQIDLQKPLQIDAIYYNGKPYINYPPKPYYNEGNVWFIPLPKTPLNSEASIGFEYHGRPREAILPPWDGGWIWKRDDQQRPWMSVACQGLGASSWYPCKDYQGDEPDNGALLSIVVPDTLIGVGNGRLKSKIVSGASATYQWEVKTAINNYDIVPYIGKYVNWSDTLMGEKGKLDVNFWALQQDTVPAKKQFQQVKKMLRAFEYWFGPYPFYQDGYQLIQAPHLGMEHQSAIAYGNKFQNGYLGEDRSNTGWGLKWDYIIVHESGHEWFGNNITTKDIADMWVHEGFATYSEVLFTEYYYGKEAASQYILGLRPKNMNDIPIIGFYGVNQEGSTDMYVKGANMIHTIRQLIHEDEKFRQLLRGLNKDFYHQTVTSAQVEDYISKKTGLNLGKVFDQYLRTTNIPVLEVKALVNSTKYRWHDCVPGFNMAVKLSDGTWLQPTEAWKEIKKKIKDMEVEKDFFIRVENR